jgi:hypothetical protein
MVFTAGVVRVTGSHLNLLPADPFGALRAGKERGYGA